MTDIEAAEKVLAQLQDQRDRATARVNEITVLRQPLAYAVAVNGNDKCRAELATMNRQLAELATAIETVDQAFAEARKRLDAAKAAARASDAEERRLRVHKLLEELQACSAQLDASVDPDDPISTWRGPAPRYLAMPVTYAKTAALTGALLVELRALKLDRGATFPAHQKWELANRSDLMIELRKTIWSYQYDRFSAGQQRNFETMIGGWCGMRTRSRRASASASCEH